MLRHPPIVCVLLALAGCQGEDGPSSISGSMKMIFVGESGDEVVAVGPDDIELAALVQGGKGDWSVSPVPIDRDGRFTTDPVPAGPYYLRVRTPDGGWPYFLSVGTRAVELSTQYLGRPGAVVPEQETPLTIEADGLKPWAAGNQLHLFSLGAGAFEDDLERLAGLRLPETTERIALTVDSASLRQPGLVNTDEGDHLFITQFGIQSQHTVDYWTPVSVLRADSLVQEEGVPNAVRGAFEPIATATNQLVKWKPGAFVRAAPAVNPMATVKVHAMFFVADPAGADREGGGLLPEVMHTAVEANQVGTTSWPFTPSYRNPYPPAWPVKYRAYSRYEIPWLPEWLWPVVSIHGRLDPANELQIELRLAPPQHLQVDGRDASGTINGTGLTPALRWQAPATGKATLYEAEMWQQDETGEFQLAGAVVTDRRDAVIPPEVLSPGRPYVVLVTAFDDRAPAKPDQNRPQGAHATAVTGLLMP
jgi:hypothetical protein